MATNLAIDPEILAEAHRIGGHRTKKATVTEALEEYVQRRKQLRVVRLFGTIDYDPDYDYKAQRARSISPSSDICRAGRVLITGATSKSPAVGSMTSTRACWLAAPE